MKVKVLYLASLREQLGKPGEDLEVPPATSTVAGDARIVPGVWPMRKKRARRRLSAS